MPTNQELGIYVHGEKVIQSPVHGGLIPVHGGRSPVHGSSNFDPLSLFQLGEVGFLWDPSDISTLFQDTAGTTPITTAGQTTAKMNDKSGRGFHLTQATAGSRPPYQVDGGGKPYLDFDGVADILINTTAAPLMNAAAMTLIMAVQGNATSNAGVYCEADTASLNAFAKVAAVSSISPFTALSASLRNNDAVTQPIASTNFEVAGGFGAGVPKILTVEDIRTQYRGRVNRGAFSTTAYTRGPMTLGQASLGGLYRQVTAGNFVPMRFYGAIGVGRVLTAAEMVAAENYLAAKCGLTL